MLGGGEVTLYHYHSIRSFNMMFTLRVQVQHARFVLIFFLQILVFALMLMVCLFCLHTIASLFTFLIFVF